MILIPVIQDLIPQSFFGGSGLELSNVYSDVSKRGAVCADKVLDGYGPVRFRRNSTGEVTIDGSFFTLRQNFHFGPAKIDGITGRAPLFSPDVDSITPKILPIEWLGIRPIYIPMGKPIPLSNPSTLEISPEPQKRGWTMHGSDCIKDLVNLGFSKPIEYPSLLGESWFGCQTLFSSEKDVLTAIAQTASCKLEDKGDKYVFEPNIEQIRNRALSTLDMFGTPSDDILGIAQRISYRALQLASSDVIHESISNQKMFREVPLPDDPELKKLCERFKILKMEEYKARMKDKATREFKPDGHMALGYMYRFEVHLFVELTNGHRWMM